MLSQSIEDYVKAIYKLGGDGMVATGEIARELDVSSASVTNMIKRLAAMKLVEYESHKGVRLTEASRKVALEIIRHHRLLETYLREVLGYEWDKMHEEAERLEHHISEEFESKIDELLGYPTHDPHGHPIPSRDLEIDEVDTMSLAEMEEGQSVVIHHVSDSIPELLKHLEALGLLPQRSIRVIDKAPFNGPLTLRIGRKSQIVGHEIARHVFVTAY